MELVYLWVEGHKNIKEEGFNFSPRFDCSYDKNTKELTINENKDYVNIFPENINVTAIVGENGSGKSNLINSITTWINEEEYFFIYKVKNENKLFCSNPSKLNIEFPNYNIETIDIKTDKSQSGVYYNFKSFYYSESLFFDDINGSTDISFKDFLFKNIDCKSSNKSFELTKTLTKKILQLLKRDIKAIPIEFKSHYLEVHFHNDISKNSISKNLEKYENDKNIYTIPFNEFEIFENLFNELISFDILFKYNKNYKKVPSLPSQGEISLLYLLSSIYNELIPILDDDKKDHKDFYGNNILLILDEPINSFHPQWQKKFIYYLTNFLKENFSYIEFQIIVTSHSPFILSDLPKENIIFLKKDENSNCINVTKETKIDTFGANIHTLLSHGFFMEDGLIGEFAKEKINDVIKYLNSEESIIQSIKEAQNIINIIGEPVLKSTLQNMLNEKKYPNDSKLEKLKKEKERLEKEIKELEGKSDE